MKRNSLKYGNPKTGSLCFKYLLLGCFVLISSMASNSETEQLWSERVAKSVMQRNPEPWTVDFRTKLKWEYTEGLLMKAMLDLWEVNKVDTFYNYALRYYNTFVNEDGSIKTYKLEDYNIDRINPGKGLFTIYRETSEEKYKKAIFLLRKQMREHPRTNEGGYWHKKIYPYQMWLDGLYMGAPFLAQFAEEFDEPELFDDVANQFIWMEKHARDSETGLLYHGWDESKEQRWADPETGLSKHFWGRGMGWYAMALVDVLDFLPEDHKQRGDIIAILQRLATAVASVQDSASGVWYQVLDQGSREGNYLESSASCMFVYALSKAVNNGYIDSGFWQIAQKGFDGILNEFIEVRENGIVDIHQACAGAGLGGNPYRDGTYEYYINEEIRSNDPKAVGPFIMAALQFERNKKTQ